MPAIFPFQFIQFLQIFYPKEYNIKLKSVRESFIEISSVNIEGYMY
jgi:hypothetical protein